MNYNILTLDATIKSFSVLATGIDVKYTYAYKSVHDVFSEASKGDMVVGYVGNPINQFRYVLEIEAKISEKECEFRFIISIK